MSWRMRIVMKIFLLQATENLVPRTIPTITYDFELFPCNGVSFVHREKWTEPTVLKISSREVEFISKTNVGESSFYTSILEIPT